MARTGEAGRGRAGPADAAASVVASRETRLLIGRSGSLSFTAGVMLWPVVLIMTDVINGHFGTRGVRPISWLAVAFIVYAFLFADLEIALARCPSSSTMAVAVLPLLYLGRRAIRGYFARPAGGSD